MKGFQQNLQRLAAANTQVLGVSMDSTFANKAWAEKIGVSFPLLSDRSGQVTRAYGIYNPEYEAARRATFLIGPDGRIEHIQLDQAAIDPAQTVVACERKAHHD